MRQKFLTFLLVFLMWIIIVGKISTDVVIIGIIASSITTILFSNMLFRFTNRKLNLFDCLRKIFLVIIFIPVFFYEALLAAIKVSFHAFERRSSFSPGIVKVKTKLTNVTAITILANLITLTPGTLTLDFDTTERVYYIHWIDVVNREDEETHRHLIEKFERWLGVIFK